MHLQGTVTSTKSDTPVTVTKQLDFIMACLLYVQLDQNVFIITNAVRFDLIEDLTNHCRRFSSCFGDRLLICIFKCQQVGPKNTLPLTTTTADRLKAETATGIGAE